jgi:hypothetical protein
MMSFIHVVIRAVMRFTYIRNCGDNSEVALKVRSRLAIATEFPAVF